MSSHAAHSQFHNHPFLYLSLKITGLPVNINSCATFSIQGCWGGSITDNTDTKTRDALAHLHAVRENKNCTVLCSNSVPRYVQIQMQYINKTNSSRKSSSTCSWIFTSKERRVENRVRKSCTCLPWMPVCVSERVKVMCRISTDSQQRQRLDLVVWPDAVPFTFGKEAKMKFS